MIPLTRLDLPNLRTRRRTRLQLVCHLLKILHQTASNLPPQTTPLTRLVLTHIPSYLVELRAIAELLKGFFFFRVLFAEDVAHVYRGCGLELAFSSATFGLAAAVVFGLAFAFVFGCHCAVRGEGCRIERRACIGRESVRGAASTVGKGCNRDEDYFDSKAGIGSW